MPAKTTPGLRGFHARSDAPLLGPTYSVLVHVLPPSTVRKTPRSALSAKGSPKAATRTTFGLRASMRIREICEVPPRPRCSHVLPPSRETKTPSPYDTSLRGL